MPRIDLITPVFYESLQPYNAEFDNLPLRYILARQQLINSAVDQNEEILRDAIGTQGTLANRLAQSINPNGSLIDDAVDEALHNIGAHTDGEYEGIEYVRMTAEERAKLENISENATALSIQFSDISTTPTFDNEAMILADSSTITWTIEEPNIVTANLAFSESSAHQHYYNLEPVQAETPADYTNYKVNSLATAYVEGSLRVYVNGIRLNEDNGVYVYSADGPGGTWTLTNFTSDPENGLFSLNRALDPEDIIVIDFDRALT